MAKASGVGQGPAKGLGNGNPKNSLEITPEKQSARAQKGWLKRKMAAYAAGNPESRVTVRTPTRVEISALAQSGMPEAVQALELIIHTSRSDTARVQAFQAYKEVAYGNDRQTVNVAMDFSHMSDDELMAEIAAEFLISSGQASNN